MSHRAAVDLHTDDACHSSARGADGTGIDLGGGEAGTEADHCDDEPGRDSHAPTGSSPGKRGSRRHCPQVRGQHRWRNGSPPEGIEPVDDRGDVIVGHVLVSVVHRSEDTGVTGAWGKRSPGRSRDSSLGGSRFEVIGVDALLRQRAVVNDGVGEGQGRDEHPLNMDFVLCIYFRRA